VLYPFTTQVQNNLYTVIQNRIRSPRL